MIAFQRPTLADRAQLVPMLFDIAYHGCEYSYVNICLWGQQQFAIVEGEVVIFSHWDGRSMYVYPGTAKLEKILPLLREDARQRGIPLRLYGLTGEGTAEIETRFPGQYGFTRYRDGGDYLYEIERLAELRGKKLQQKRNHINRFLERYPDWHTQPISAENMDACKALAQRWYRQREEAGEDVTLEKVAMSRAFAAYDALGMEGLALYAEGSVVAMTMGNRMRREIFDVNFEKADAEIAGAYPLINREFARYIHAKYPEIRYLNREEDMGLPGLRKSKLSYHPDEIVEKYRGFLKPEVQL